METMSAREAKNGSGLMIDTARADPVQFRKRGRSDMVVLAIEEYERLKVIEVEMTGERLNKNDADGDSRR